MKFYDNTDNFKKRVHTIRVTFQFEDYKGHIAYEIGGNCQGMDTMDFDPEIIDSDEIMSYKENDCKFSYDEDDDCFRMTLTNDKDETCDFDWDSADDVRRKVVAIEIINCKFE